MDTNDWIKWFEKTPANAFSDWIGVVSSWYPGMPFAGEYWAAMDGIRSVYPAILEPIDWLPFYVHHRLTTFPIEVDGGPIIASGVSTVVDLLPSLPKFVPHARLKSLKLFGQAEELLSNMIEWPEFVERGLEPTSERFVIEWRNGTWSKGGSIVLGQLSRISPKERARLETVIEPYWKMTLSLPAWVIMSDDERRALVHHEMCHAWIEDGKPKIRSHEIEEFAATAGRFGVADPGRAAVILHAASHPVTRQTWVDAGWDGDQGLLFTPFRGERALKAV